MWSVVAEKLRNTVLMQYHDKMRAASEIVVASEIVGWDGTRRTRNGFEVFVLAARRAITAME
jgi:hypothetical protein